MIIDITGTILTPGNGGRDCDGNGQHKDNKGNIFECCCDQCDYFLECYPEWHPKYRGERGH